MKSRRRAARSRTLRAEPPLRSCRPSTAAPTISPYARRAPPGFARRNPRTAPPTVCSKRRQSGRPSTMKSSSVAACVEYDQAARTRVVRRTIFSEGAEKRVDVLGRRDDEDGLTRAQPVVDEARDVVDQDARFGVIKLDEMTVGTLRRTLVGDLHRLLPASQETFGAERQHTRGARRHGDCSVAGGRRCAAEAEIVEDLPAGLIGASIVAAVFAIVVAVFIVRPRRNARRAAEDARALMLAGSVPHMIWTATSRGAVDYANRRFAEYAGIASDVLSAEGWEGLLDPRDRAHTMAAWNAAVAAETSFRAEARLRRADGVHRFHLLLADPARDASGAVMRWFGSCTDIADQKGGERMLAVLAEVTQAVSRSLDQLEIARSLADVVAPRELAYCEILLFGPDGRLYQAASAGDAGKFDDERRTRAAHVQRAGAMLVTRALSVVPATIGDEVLGWLVCCDVANGVHALVPELALRLGAAIANANAYAREHRVATSFQRAALDEDVPDVPGLRFSVLYHAAQSEASVGGDWYDAFRLPDGRVVLSVGDVAGSGLEAAVTMASVRQSIRTAVLINPDPKAVLDAVDRIVRAMGHNRFVTAFVGVLDPVCSRARVRERRPSAAAPARSRRSRHRTLTRRSSARVAPGDGRRSVDHCGRTRLDGRRVYRRPHRIRARPRDRTPASARSGAPRSGRRRRDAPIVSSKRSRRGARRTTTSRSSS